MFKNIQLLATRSVLVISLIAVAVIAALVTFQEQQYYQDRIKISKSNSSMLVDVLSEYVETSFVSLDLMLENLVGFEHSANVSTHKFNNFATDMQKKMPQIKAVYTLDARGNIKHSLAGYIINQPQATAEISKIFEHHKNHPQDRLKISNLYSAEIDNYYVVLSRPLQTIESGLAGLALIVIDCGYLNKFFASVELNHNTEMAFLLDNNHLLLRSPDIIEDIDVIEAIKSESVKFNDRNTQRGHSERFIHGYLHIFSFKQLSHLPIKIALISFEGDIIKNWFSKTENIILLLLIAAIVVATLVLIALAIVHQLEKNQRIDHLKLLTGKSRTGIFTKMLQEIKVPVNAIMGIAKILEMEYMGALNAKQKARVHDISSCSNYLLEIIGDITKIAKNESGEVVLSAKLVHLVEIIDKALLMLSQRITLEGIQVTYAEDLTKLPPFKLDKFKICQVIISVINMLLKYTQIGGNIHISAILQASNNIGIKIMATPVELSKEYVEDILSLTIFSSKEEETDELIAGLLLAKLFVELHHGKVEFARTEENEVYFLILLPLDDVKNI